MNGWQDAESCVGVSCGQLDDSETVKVPRPNSGKSTYTNPHVGAMDTENATQSPAQGADDISQEAQPGYPEAAPLGQPDSHEPDPVHNTPYRTISKRPLFSIIVPVYLVEEFIDECVNSLFNQTFEDFEIILVDDGSPDSCPELCDDFARADDRVRVIHQPNAGLSAARNAGIHASTGQYLLFVDSDDYLDHRALEWLAEETDTQPDAIAFSGIRIHGPMHTPIRAWVLGSSPMSLPGDALLCRELQSSGAMMAAWLNAFRRDLVVGRNLLFKVGRLHEDEEWTPRALLASKHVRVCPRLVYYYRVRSGSITQRADRSENARHIMTTVLELTDLYSGLPDAELRRAGLAHAVILFFQAISMGTRSQARVLTREYGSAMRHRAQSLTQSLRVRFACAAPAVYHELVWAKRRIRR